MTHRDDRSFPVPPDSPYSLGLVNALAVLYTKRGRHDKAELLFEEVWNGRKKKLGEDHPETLATINEFGMLRREQKRYDEAEKLLLEAVEGRRWQIETVFSMLKRNMGWALRARNYHSQNHRNPSAHPDT